VGCVQCTSASVCSKCTQIAGVNYYLNATACLSICPTGTLGITDGSGDLVCTACTGPCATCSGAITYCLSCTSGNVLYYTEATCSAHCPDGEYDGGSGACKPCAIYCKTCSSSALDCQSCKSLGGVGYYLSGTSCLISCPEGTFKNSSALTCDVCPSGCPSCFGPTLADCYSCTSNATDTFYLVYGTSTCGACPDGQYAVNATMKCMLCASTCLTCSVTSTSCLTCSFSSLLGAHLYLSGSQCLMSCPTGYWGNVTDHKCTACHVGCAACTDDTITSCTVCANASGTLYYKHIGETVCNTTCPDGQFISASIPFLCQKCGSTCVTCSSTADNCTSSSCAANLYYLSNSCLTACPTGYYADSSKQCQLCAAGCYSCFGASASSCSKCLTLANTTVYYLKDLSTCSQSCDPGYYGNDTLHLCVACSSACKTCTSPTVCQSCQSVNGVGYFLNATACLVLCPLGTYGRVTDYTCQICATGCLSCFGAAVTQCFNCTGDY
jgi:proprotein convertase subtilisin/kexin type 5